MPNLTDIPGIPELWRCTLGDSRIKIAILDSSQGDKGVIWCSILLLMREKYLYI